MAYLFTVFLVLFFVGLGVCRVYAKANTDKPVTSGKVTAASRSEIEQLLKNIEQKPAPVEKMGAMCYKPSAIKEHVEYICPLDGEKTVYANGQWGNMDQLRRQVQQLNSVTKLAVFKLDEKRLCHKCSPKLKQDDRYASLITRYPDGQEVRYDRVTTYDLRLLTGFFEKQLFYTTSNDGEVPLKEQLPHIRQMLGLSENSSLQKRN